MHSGLVDVEAGSPHTESRAGSPHLVWINHFAVSPGEAGGTRHFELARELVRRGWRVDLVAADFNLHARRYTRRSSPSDRRPIPETIDGVRFHWLWTGAYERNDWRRAWNWLSFGRSLRRWARDRRSPDVVIGSSPHLFAARTAARLASRWRAPFVFEVRDLWPESLLALGRRRGPAYWVLAAIAERLYARADRIIVLARGAADHLQARGVDERKIRFVPNGVDATAFDGDRGPRADAFTLVYAGAHGPANGLDLVLAAAERLRRRDRIRFLLVGDGPAKTELVAAARERRLTNVEFRDPVPKQQVPALFAEADAGLMILRDAPLFSFGVSPNKLFDYCAAGLPVVCNVPGEVAAMVRSSGAGVVAPAGSAEELASAVARLADRSAEELRAIGDAGRRWVVREHGRPVLARRLDELLSELAGTAPASG